MRVDSPNAAGDCADVVLVVPPFADVECPSLGVSLLIQAARRAGSTARVLYANVTFAEIIGSRTYLEITDQFDPASLVGEWIFAAAALGAAAPPAEGYLREVLGSTSPVRYSGAAGLGKMGSPPHLVEAVIDARDRAAAFVHDCAEEVMQMRPRVVGLTSMFHQTTAGLAIAAAIKARPDPPLVIMGGSNCEGEMGRALLEAAPQLDFVCCGDGDVAFARWLERLGDAGAPLPRGILGRDSPPDAPTLPAPIVDMDSVAIPDFDDYFDRIARSPAVERDKVRLTLETSRGCWWGAKHHCTFCGLNGSNMSFRSKSPERAVHEIETLVARYGTRRIDCVDNILDLAYMDTVLPALADAEVNPQLFYETKANLKLEHLQTMSAAGVLEIQPGVESLSDQILKLMRKGCTGLQNLQLLRWCDETGIHAHWNVIYAFPGEDPGEYRKMAAIVPLIEHLRPPQGTGPMRLDRFSPYFETPTELGVRNIRPTRAYQHVFPLPEAALARLAYFFDFDFATAPQDTAMRAGGGPPDYAVPLLTAIDRWRTAHRQQRRPRLDALRLGSSLLVIDERSGREPRVHRLDGVEAELYLFCDSVRAVSKVRSTFADRLDADAVSACLERLRDEGLVLIEDGRCLSLAVLRNRDAARRVAIAA